MKNLFKDLTLEKILVLSYLIFFVVSFLIFIVGFFWSFDISNIENELLPSKTNINNLLKNENFYPLLNISGADGTNLFTFQSTVPKESGVIYAMATCAIAGFH